VSATPALHRTFRKQQLPDLSSRDVTYCTANTE